MLLLFLEFFMGFFMNVIEDYEDDDEESSLLWFVMNLINCGFFFFYECS